MRKYPVKWLTVFFLLLFHTGAVYALFNFSWRFLCLAITVEFIGHCLGVGICLHRLLTHRGFKTAKAFEYTLTICALLAAQGGHISWVSTHRIHHVGTDKPGDPHSPSDGFFWAHMGWVIFKDPRLNQIATLKKYAPDLYKDPVHKWLNTFWWLPISTLALVLFLVGGFPAVAWGTFFPVTFGLHASWLVNSACHKWGKRKFSISDTSTNNWLVAILAWGEGWHNNHHARPTNPRHGIKWYQLDFSWYTIWALRKLAVIKDVRLS